MLSALALIGLLAEPNAARSLTATDEVTSVLVPLAPAPGSALQRRWQPFGFSGSSTEAFLDLSSGLLPSGGRTARARLGLDGRFSLGRFASSLASSFAHWSISVGMDVETMARPEPTGSPGDGLLVARIGRGFYLGHAPAVRAEVFPYREYLHAKPALFTSGVQLGIDGTLFLTRSFGIRLDLRGGAGTFAGLSFIYRP
jgi:hypothetical protein